MWVQLRTGDIILPDALVDSGSQRTLMVESLARSLPQADKTPLHRVFVLSASRHQIKVLYSITLPLCARLSGASLGSLEVYVVDDSGEHSLPCPFILGRPGVSNSGFPYIDTRGDGALESASHAERIDCVSRPICLCNHFHCNRVRIPCRSSERRAPVLSHV